MVVILGGIDRSKIVSAALNDTTLADAATVRFEPACAPPCDATLWRLETASGEAVNSVGVVARHWHRSPYAFTLRLVRYAPGSMVPDILDEGTIGTRVPRDAFTTALERLAMRFVRDAILGGGRGPAASPPAGRVHGLPGWMDRFGVRWRDRLMCEWWSLGTTSTSLNAILAGDGLNAIHWYNPEAGRRYLADPFPWFGTGRILCEEMPLGNGVGRIVAVADKAGRLGAPAAIFEDGFHHSYPCTFSADNSVYFLPEATERGATRIHQLDQNGVLVPVCDIAPHSRLADPTLFRWNDLYWIACTDLDLGEHDNLCLLHAARITGPWIPHARWPVRIDVRGARCAGSFFSLGGRLFRPGQDCAATYGAAVAIHEVKVLTEAEFSETVVTVLRPDRTGPFPHGLHTLVHDGERFWVDGKRFVLDVQAIGLKLLGKASRTFSRAGVV